MGKVGVVNFTRMNCVTSIATAGLISGGVITTSGTITTNMNTNKLVGRYDSGQGIMIDPFGIVTINGQVLVMEESNSDYQKYLLFLQSGGTVQETQIIAPYIPPPAINMKG
jgi:hypothetical protein